MNKYLRWIIYILLTLIIIILIPFQPLSDYIGNLNLDFIGEGEDAYNNCDIIAFIIQVSSGVLIAYAFIKVLKKIF